MPARSGVNVLFNLRATVDRKPEPHMSFTAFNAIVVAVLVVVTDAP